MGNAIRKLAAIMFTDMVGYSALAQQNEKLSLELLEKHRVMVRAVLPEHHGKEIKTIGDAFLMEFASALDAVNCAIAIQQEFRNYNQICVAEQKIQIRIGIHVGDVICSDGDIYGDGVNISSRIEPLAEPGGICISEDVARQVQNKLKVPLKKIDSHKLKNIRLPVEIFQIVLNQNPAGISFALEQNKLAVLPFQNISPDKETDYFSDGLTEELIMHLSGIKELKVVSRTTSMQYKNACKDLNSIGRELRARYILEGSVRKHRDDLRITAQLIDVETDSHLWAENYLGNLADVFVIQEKVAKQIVQAMRLTLSPAEAVALEKRTTHSTEAFDINLRAREFLFRYTKSCLLSAIDHFQKAIALDPRYAAAYAGMSEAYAMLYEAHDKKAAWLEKALDASLRALMYDNASSEAYSALGFVYYIRNSNQEALTSIQKAIDLDADNFFAYWILGRIYHITDRNADAVEQFNRVLALNPDFHTVYADLQLAYKKLEDPEKLADIIARALRFYPPYLLRYPDDARAHIFFAFTLLDVGCLEEARSKMSRAVELSPDDATMIYNAACFFAAIGDKALAVEHLQKAVANGFEGYEYIKHDPDLDSIRNETGYLDLMNGRQ